MPTSKHSLLLFYKERIYITEKKTKYPNDIYIYISEYMAQP